MPIGRTDWRKETQASGSECHSFNAILLRGAKEVYVKQRFRKAKKPPNLMCE